MGSAEVRARIAVGSVYEGLETVYLISKGVHCILRASLPVEGTGTRSLLVVDMVVFLEFVVP